MTLPVAKEDLRILAGALKEWRRRADSGREVACFFCPDCGTRVYHSSLLGPAYWHLKPGTLDDTGWLDPVAEVWTQAAQPWLQLSNDLPEQIRCPPYPESAPGPRLAAFDARSMGHHAPQMRQA